MLDGALRLRVGIGAEPFLTFQDEEDNRRGVLGRGMAHTHRGVEGSSLYLNVPMRMDA